MMTKYTIRVTELLGSGPQPQITAFVAAESIEEAVRIAGDRYACHTAQGIEYDVQVFIGERGWYHPDQCVWRGRVTFSQCRNSQFQMHEASA